MLINCPACCEPAEIIGEGVAKAKYDEHGNKTEMYFTEFDGYSVQCTNCFEQTFFFNTIEEAVQNWNDPSSHDDTIDKLFKECINEKYPISR